MTRDFSIISCLVLSGESKTSPAPLKESRDDDRHCTIDPGLEAISEFIAKPGIGKAVPEESLVMDLST